MGSDGSDVRCCWVGCVEEGWGEYGGCMSVGVGV